MEINVICYKTKEPIYYNKGTKWERSCNESLACYTHTSDEETQAEVDRLNSEKPERFKNGQKIDWEKIDYFFASKQKEFEG